MRRVDLLRRHIKTDRYHQEFAPGSRDPQVAYFNPKKWNLYYVDFPPEERFIYFVCSPMGRPFPRSGCYHASGSITMFLSTLNLPDHLHDPKTGAPYCGATQEPERKRWWAWFKKQGYGTQKFEINPTRDDPSWSRYLRHELKFEREMNIRRNNQCVFCYGKKRLDAITRDLEQLIKTIDWYSERPEEQKRWLATMAGTVVHKRGVRK